MYTVVYSGAIGFLLILARGPPLFAGSLLVQRLPAVATSPAVAPLGGSLSTGLRVHSSLIYTGCPGGLFFGGRLCGSFRTSRIPGDCDAYTRDVRMYHKPVNYTRTVWFFLGFRNFRIFRKARANATPAIHPQFPQFCVGLFGLQGGALGALFYQKPTRKLRAGGKVPRFHFFGECSLDKMSLGPRSSATKKIRTP